MERKLKEQGLRLAGNYSNCTHICCWDETEWGVDRWFECTIGGPAGLGLECTLHDGTTGWSGIILPKDTDSCRVGSEVIAYYKNQK